MSAGIAHANLDGDGRQDLIASNAQHDWSTGVSYVFHGDIGVDTSTADADAKIYGTVKGQSAGCAVVGPGDVDGDGNGDLLLSACTDGTSGTYAGAVFLLYGPFAGTMDVDADQQAAWLGSDPGGAAGTELAAGEVTGDGIGRPGRRRPGGRGRKGDHLLVVEPLSYTARYRTACANARSSASSSRGGSFSGGCASSHSTVRAIASSRTDRTDHPSSERMRRALAAIGTLQSVGSSSFRCAGIASAGELDHAAFPTERATDERHPVALDERRIVDDVVVAIRGAVVRRCQRNRVTDVVDEAS